MLFCGPTSSPTSTGLVITVPSMGDTMVRSLRLTLSGVISACEARASASAAFTACSADLCLACEVVERGFSDRALFDEDLLAGHLLLQIGQVGACGLDPRQRGALRAIRPPRSSFAGRWTRARRARRRP